MEKESIAHGLEWKAIFAYNSVGAEGLPLLTRI